MKIATDIQGLMIQEASLPLAPPMQIQSWPVERLIFYARNPRKNDAAVDRMCGSIREFGFKIPVLARSDGEVVDGHLRLKAAHKLSIGEVPVIVCDEWTPAQVKAFRLLVNLWFAKNACGPNSRVSISIAAGFREARQGRMRGT